MNYIILNLRDYVFQGRQ